MFYFTSFYTCIEALVAMGYNRTDIEDSLAQSRYDDVFATYLLLGRKNTDVSFLVCVCFFFVLGSEHAIFSPNLMVLDLDLRYLYGISPEMTQMPFLIRPCKVQPIVVYIEAFPLPVQNQVDEHQVVAKRYVSIL